MEKVDTEAMKVEFLEKSKSRLMELNVAVVLADREEFPEKVELKNRHKLFITGIGKVNATMKMTEIIHTFSPDLVINLGTAGSPKLVRDNVYQCENFIQKDMDATAIGYKKYTTPGESTEQIFQYKYLTTNLEQAICGTADMFTACSDNDIWNLNEMEGYALAKTCYHYNVPFLCFKAISDGADESSVKDYRDSFATIPEKLYQVYKDLCDA
ncbi:MAG: 5'-methylthioadenosine/S-adenosylhomocysteine nucleosidase [Rickettsiales bacterium]|nr:5'-methylthioadenosine/S-adenosylhomocysteine nucleosidase [Rickettsiales bacterium]